MTPTHTVVRLTAPPASERRAIDDLRDEEVAERVHAEAAVEGLDLDLLLRRFKAALRDFEAQAHSPARPPLTSVAFPDKIGCGLAGGRWSDYLHEIEEFKRRNPLVRVIVIEYSE